MWLVGLFTAFTMSSGAVVPDRRLLRWINGPELPPLLREDDSSGSGLSAEMNCREPDWNGAEVLEVATTAGTLGTSPLLAPVDPDPRNNGRTDSGSDAGAQPSTLTPTPSTKGNVEPLLSRPGVRAGVDEILRALEQRLPGYASILEVVNDPSENEDYAFLMVSVCMRGDDQVAWDFVEELIDDHWLNLPAEVRGVLGVGREFIHMG